MDQLFSWFVTVSGWCWNTNVRPSGDDPRASDSEFVDLGQTSHPTDSAKLPERYLHLATECVVRAQRMTSESASTKLKPNHNQCTYLTGELKTAVEESRMAYTRSFSLEHQAECLETLKLLYRLAKEVVSFIQDSCKDKAWIQAALTSGSVPVRVSTLGCYLKLCSVLLRNSNKLGGAWLTFTKLDGEGEAALRAVKVIASKDEANLMRLLESLTLPSKLKTKEVQVATVLLERLKGIQAMSTAGSPQSSNLGPWKVDRRHTVLLTSLGTGASAHVHRGKWFGAVKVAVKILSGHENPDFARQVALEAGFSHPNIVTLFGHWTYKETYGIIMELMDGDLSLLMQQRMQEEPNRTFPFSIWEACDIMLQVAEGVLYMHQNRVVHADLKSLKILVKSSKHGDTEYVNVKVTTSGLSKARERSSTYSSFTPNLGKTRWMAPELIQIGIDDAIPAYSNMQKVVKYPFKTDVYSFGMLCYEILTGNLPFSELSPREVRSEVLAGHRPHLPEQCPENLKNLIQLCWDSQPNTRPSFTNICEELRYLRCSLLLDPLDQDNTHQPTLPIPEPLDLPEEVSKFKGEYSSLKVVRVLGKGGSDIVTVYLSTWTGPKDAKEVAQKLFIGSHNQCFVNEVSIMADLEHRNVARLFYYATDRRSCSIVMELMDEDLHDLMRRRRLECNETPTGPFSVDMAVHVILQIAQGMDYVHNKNVVHMDLKSCNILVRKATDRGQLDVKVADFGLSRKLESRRTFLGKDSAVGTIRWMAPEVLSLLDDSDEVYGGTSKYDPFKSDVYSFGMVCYEVLAGRVPFYEMENLSEVKKLVLDGGRPALPEWMPCNLKAVVEKCWQKEASGRPSFAEIIVELTSERMRNLKADVEKYWQEEASRRPSFAQIIAELTERG